MGIFRYDTGLCVVKQKQYCRGSLQTCTVQLPARKPARYDIQQAGTSDILGPEKGRPWRSSCKHDGCFGQHLLLCCAYVSLHMRASTFSETRYKEVLTLARQLQITVILLPVIRLGLSGGPAGQLPKAPAYKWRYDVPGIV